MFLNFFKPTQNFLFLYAILLIKFHNYELNTNVNQRFYTNATATNLFRFRDFEPRYTMKTDTEVTPRMFDGLVRNTRKSRGFQFHATDSDISIDMEFIVPFIRVPIARSMAVAKTAFRNLFNLNVQSLLTTGGIVAVGGIVAIVLRLILTPYVQIAEYKKNSRNDDNGKVQSILNSLKYKTYADNATNSLPNVNQFASIVEKELRNSNINISHCVQNSICNYVQKAFLEVKTSNGAAGGLQKIIDGVISLDLVRNYLSGTAIQEALDSAKSEENCDAIYRDCNFSFPTTKILKFFTKNFNALNTT